MTSYEEEKITINFNRISLEDAIERVSRNYVYEKKSKGGKITNKKSTVEEEKGLVKPGSKEKSSRPEHFKFEFDPSEFMEKK